MCVSYLMLQTTGLTAAHVCRSLSLPVVWKHSPSKNTQSGSLRLVRFRRLRPTHVPGTNNAMLERPLLPMYMLAHNEGKVKEHTTTNNNKNLSEKLLSYRLRGARVDVYNNFLTAWKASVWTSNGRRLSHCTPFLCPAGVSKLRRGYAD